MVRRIACTVGAVALATPTVLGLSAGTAFASGSFSSPTPDSGSSLSSASFQVKANTTAKGTTVSLSGPRGYGGQSKSSSTSITASNNQTVTLDSVDASAYPNGTWTATISGGDTRSWYSNFAPATPSGFSVSTTDGDPNDVFLSWNKGSEPDLQSYSLFEANGALIQSGITPGSACGGSTCHYALYYDNPTPGTYNYGYQLSASRAGGCGSGSCRPVESGKTETRTATLVTPKPPPPPPPSPTPQPTPTGGSSTGSTTAGGTTAGGDGSTGGTADGSTGGSATGGTTAGGTSGAGSSTGAVIAPSAGPLPTLPPDFASKATALNFRNFSPNLGIPKLPPLPNITTTVTLPGEGSEQQGTYNPTLPYKQVASEPAKSTSVLAPIATSIGIDPDQLAKSLAVALLLIMTAAHLRRWVGAHVEG